MCIKDSSLSQALLAMYLAASSTQEVCKNGTVQLQLNLTGSSMQRQAHKRFCLLDMTPGSNAWYMIYIAYHCLPLPTTACVYTWPTTAGGAHMARGCPMTSTRRTRRLW
jgi:hypothetical protein